MACLSAHYRHRPLAVAGLAFLRNASGFTFILEPSQLFFFVFFFYSFLESDEFLLVDLDISPFNPPSSGFFSYLIAIVSPLHLFRMSFPSKVFFVRQRHAISFVITSSSFSYHKIAPSSLRHFNLYIPKVGSVDIVRFKISYSSSFTSGHD